MAVPNRVTTLNRDAFFERLTALPGAALGAGAFSPGPKFEPDVTICG